MWAIASRPKLLDLAWGAFALVGSGSGSSSGTKASIPPPPRPFKIVFPEGFTRREMAKRITAVDKIAMRERIPTSRDYGRDAASSELSKAPASDLVRHGASRRGCFGGKVKPTAAN